jgi:hypothetical protein
LIQKVSQSVMASTSLIADFLSPRIAALHRLDDAISPFVIDTKDQHNGFSDFLSLGHGQQLCLTGANRQFLLSISRELGNA